MCNSGTVRSARTAVRGQTARCAGAKRSVPSSRVSAVGQTSWLTKPDRESAGFFDAGIWEEAKKKGDAAIKKMIHDALVGTSVTAVLIGAETSARAYVRYEIDQSIAKGKGLLGIRIHNIKDTSGKTDAWGSNPLPASYPIYDWVNDNGYANLGSWVDAAAKKAGK